MFEIYGVRGGIPMIKEVELFKDISLFFRANEMDWDMPVQ